MDDAGELALVGICFGAAVLIVVIILLLAGVITMDDVKGFV